MPAIFHIICVHINALKKAVKKKGTMYYEEKRNHKNKRNQESKPSNNRNTTMQVVEAADEGADKESESCNDAIGTYCGFVDGHTAKLNLMENQKFSMSVSDDSKTHTTTGEYSITDETLNLKEETGKEFALTFDGKNAILNTGETYMLFSADAAVGNAEQA